MHQCLSLWRATCFFKLGTLPKHVAISVLIPAGLFTRQLFWKRQMDWDMWSNIWSRTSIVTILTIPVIPTPSFPGGWAAPVWAHGREQQSDLPGNHQLWHRPGGGRGDGSGDGARARSEQVRQVGPAEPRDREPSHGYPAVRGVRGDGGRDCAELWGKGNHHLVTYGTWFYYK